MASTQESGSVFQAWFPAPLDEEFRKHCADERRSLSSAIRIAVEDRLSLEDNFASIPAAKAERPPSEASFPRSGRGAGQAEDG